MESATAKFVVFIVEDDPKIEKEPVTNKLPVTVSNEPSNVKLVSASAELVVLFEVNILLFE